MTDETYITNCDSDNSRFNGLLLNGCWVDIEQYKEFACDRFGGDADRDGVCSRFDCDDHNKDVFLGAPCNDGDSLTFNDMVTDSCTCEGN